MGRRLALIIANSDYKDETLGRLQAPKADVTALCSVLENKQVGAFDHVTRVVDKEFAVCRRAIAQFFADKKRNDLLLLYFSGHGILDDQGHLFLAVKDTERNLLGATGIAASFVTRELDLSFSHRQVLILDCCHSGAFARGTKSSASAVGARVGTGIAFQGNGSGRAVLTATDSTQYAWEGDRILGEATRESLFTHFLIEGLESGRADLDRNGEVTIDELYYYVYDRMAQENPKQTPGKWMYKQQGDLVIARNPKPPADPMQLPSELQDALKSPLTEVRLAVLKELVSLSGTKYRDLAVEAIRELAEDDSRKISAAALSALEELEPEDRVSKVVVTKRPPPVDPGELEEPETDAVTERPRPNLWWSAGLISILVLGAFVGWLAKDSPETPQGPEAIEFFEEEPGVEGGATEVPRQPTATTGGYSLQVFSSRSQANAEAVASRFRAMGYPSEIETIEDLEGTIYRALVGRFSSPQEAAQALQGFQRLPGLEDLREGGKLRAFVRRR